MRLILLSACLILGTMSMALAQSGEASADFLEALPDVPVMQGMEEMQDYILVFDKPEGRIIETLVHTDNIPVDDIRSYYSQTLPQLGWQKTSSDEFVREQEKLSMQYEKEFLKITVSPNQ